MESRLALFFLCYFFFSTFSLFGGFLEASLSIAGRCGGFGVGEVIETSTSVIPSRFFDDSWTILCPPLSFVPICL